MLLPLASIILPAISFSVISVSLMWGMFYNDKAEKKRFKVLNLANVVISSRHAASKRQTSQSVFNRIFLVN